jgi:hypothetical protein
VIALAIAMMCVVELVRALPLLGALKALVRTTIRTPRVWAYSRGLEARKERATLRLSAQMFRRSTLVLGLIATAVMPLVVVLVADPITGFDAHAALQSWRGRVVVALVTLTYALLRFQIIPRLRRG